MTSTMMTTMMGARTYHVSMLALTLTHTPLFSSALSLSYHRLSLMRNHHQLTVVFEQAE